MKKNQVFWTDAFTSHPFRGNPAVVCLVTTEFPASRMQDIAREFNVSETAFVCGAAGLYAIRWFTPTRELPLVGHATLAAAYVIMTAIEPALQEVTFVSELSGKLLAYREGDEYAIVLPADETRICTIPDALALGLGLTPREVRIGRHYIARYDTVDEVRAIDPNFDLLATLSRPTIAVTAPGEDCDYVLRFFAPANGVPEDSVSGVAQCSLAPYWAELLGRKELQSRQLSPRGGSMRCKLSDSGVNIFGPCRTILQGNLIDM